MQGARLTQVPFDDCGDVRVPHAAVELGGVERETVSHFAPSRPFSLYSSRVCDICEAPPAILGLTRGAFHRE